MRIPRIKNTKFSGYYFYLNSNILWSFQICISAPLSFIRSPEANIYDALRVLVPFVRFAKNVKNVHGGVLVLVKLQAKASHDSNLQLVKVLSVLYQPSQEICKHFVLQLNFKFKFRIVFNFWKYVQMKLTAKNRVISKEYKLQRVI